MKEALLIRANGTTKKVTPKKGSHFNLNELQGYVDGNIEMTETKDGKYLIVNEEGLLKNLPVNYKATGLYKYGEINIIVGDVIVCDKELIK